MSQLPIVSVLPELLKFIDDGASQIILKAAPGAGKSTHFPLSLLKHGFDHGRIVLLEPRRLAAKNIASFIAKQLGESVGETVGYRIKGEVRVSNRTRLEIVTEGILTRMIQSDPELTGIGMIIFDEFHERTIHADTGLAFALEVQGSLREDLHIVVMSATLDESQLRTLLPSAAYVESVGRGFPVECRYHPMRSNDNLPHTVVKLIQNILLDQVGSVLVFLPGIGLIKQIHSLLDGLELSADIYPLHGQLSLEQQQQAIEPVTSGRRKVVLTTNIAETSLTIEGVRVVIDSGLEKVPQFDLKTGITKLEQQRIAQSSAEQRAGRAGRLEPGICIRLFSESQFKQQAAYPVAEILRSDLSSLALELTQWGVADSNELAWLDPPPVAAISQGYDLLKSLGIVDTQRRMSALGTQVYKLGTEPRLATLLAKTINKDRHWKNSACAAVCLVEEPERGQSDLLASLHHWKTRKHRNSSHLLMRAKHFAKQLGEQFDMALVDDDKVISLLCIAFPDRIARSRSGTEHYLMANGHGAQIFSGDHFNEFIVIPSLMRHQSMSSQIELAANIDIHSLRQQWPDVFTSIEWVDWDDKQGKLVAEERVLIGELIIEKRPLAQPDKQKMTEALLNYVRRKGLSTLHWRDEERSYIERVKCAQKWLPDYHWPDLDEGSLLKTLSDWLEPFMNGVTSVKALQSLSLFSALQAYVGWEKNQILNRELPTEYQLPSGRSKNIIYDSNSEPMISLRLQEVFGMTESPSIAKGTKKLVLELLSPAMRPIQITQDLQAFWQGSYKEVQKEMKGRYPKHPWPDDPENHVATTKTKRQLSS